VHKLIEERQLDGDYRWLVRTAARAGSAPSLQAHILLTWTSSQTSVHSLTCVAADLRQVAQKDRVKNGELYRYIADNHGIFVQPAK
jgi:hypothetical protein